MTDTRLPDSWLLKPDLDKLSDGAWRVLTRAFMFCNQQGTDGHIDALYMKYVYPFGPSETLVAELEQINWLVKTEGGYLIPDWEAKGQTSAAQMELNRENSRLRARKSREKAKAPQRPVVTGDAMRDAMRDVGQERTGKERTGQVRTGQDRKGQDRQIMKQ